MGKHVPGGTKETGRSKQSPPTEDRKIKIRGCTGHFNGIYDVDELILKIMAFAFICGVIALLFL